MLRILRFIETISPGAAAVFNILLAMVVYGIDIGTGTAVQFPLLYVLPVGMAAWRNQRMLAYGIAIVLPVARDIIELPWDTPRLFIIAVINALVEIIVLILYGYLVDRTATQTRQLRKTITTREQEIGRLRAFARNTSLTLQGRGLSPGMVEGVAMIYVPPEDDLIADGQPIKPEEVESQIRRLDEALATAVRELDDLRKQLAGNGGTSETAFVDVHLAMLNDAGFWDKCKERVREEFIRAGSAVSQEIRAMAAMLEGMKQESMLERSADMRDIGRRVLRHIQNNSKGSVNPTVSLPANTILVARELLPSDVLQLDRTRLVALVTERNGPASHVAILARTRHIPMISDLKDAASLVSTGDWLLVDAEAGTVTVAPTQGQTVNFAARRSQYTTLEPAAAGPIQKSVTADGVSIRLYANLSGLDEAHLVQEYGLEGVGLFRSEFLFLDVDRPPELEAQYTIYSNLAKTLHPLPVVIRTMDLGGDKIPRYQQDESTLALRRGKRGLAFSLAEKTMFRTQLQAILRAGQEDEVRIMFPMVMNVADLRAARQIVDEIIDTEHLARRPWIGAMIETPAAVFEIHEIVKMVDFVSIGTNDLAHFILATDRQSQESPGAASFLYPSVLRATEQVVRAAVGQKISLTVCGEAAGNPMAACLLVGMGVRGLSMNPFQAGRVHHALRRVTLEQIQAAVREALTATTPEEVHRIAAAAFQEAKG